MDAVIIVISDGVKICHWELCAASLPDCSLSDFEPKEENFRKLYNFHKVHQMQKPQCKCAQGKSWRDRLNIYLHY